MRSGLIAAALAAALAGLAGCDDAAGNGPPPPPDLLMAPVAGGPPFIETMDGSVSAEAVAACQSLLESQTEGGVQVVGSEFSEANTAIYMRVGAAGAPWRCLVSADGTGASVLFMGDEGAA